MREGTGARRRQAHAGFSRSKKREDEALRRSNLPVCKIGWKRQINPGRRGRRFREMEPVVERGQRHEERTQDCAATERRGNTCRRHNLRVRKMKNEREKEAGKERETVVEREGTYRADDKATPPQQPGKRELTAEPAAAASHFIELILILNENMNDDDEDFFS